MRILLDTWTYLFSQIYNEFRNGPYEFALVPGQRRLGVEIKASFGA
jgi:hypothetical protein